MRPARRRDDRGFTLVEIMVTSALMLIVLAMVLPQLAGSITLFDDAQVRSDTTDQAQLAIAQIKHDVVAANTLYVVSGNPDVVHIQTYSGTTPTSTTTSTTAPPSTCVEYQVLNGVLQRRTKAPAAAVWPTSWSNVMTGIVNSTQTGSPAVFSVPGPSDTPPGTYRSLVVNLWVNSDARRTGQPGRALPTQYTATVTGAAIPSNAASLTGACQ